jgi:hypothetical protein
MLQMSENGMDRPAVLLPLTAFDRGIEAGGAHRHVKADQRDIRQDYWYRYS